MAKIMIVEDDVTTSNLVGDYLIDAGHTVFSAWDGLEALRCFRQESIELIILDIMLPNMDGIQVLKEIRKTSNVPILMLTVLSDEKRTHNELYKKGFSICSTEMAAKRDCLSDFVCRLYFRFDGPVYPESLRYGGGKSEETIWRHVQSENRHEQSRKYAQRWFHRPIYRELL